MVGQKIPKKGQIPFIELNGEQIADSNFIIEQLPKTIGIQSLDAHLTDMERAKLRSLLALIEDKIFWSYYGLLSIEGSDALHANDLYDTVAWYLKPFLVSKFQSIAADRCKFHGIGRQSVEEIVHLLKTDLKALSMLFGEQEYMMGSRPTSVDAAAFGHLACGFLRHSKQKEVMESQRFFREECKNLFAYMKRMIAEYYPDWKQLAPKGIDV